jgi:hypothetical protein
MFCHMAQHKLAPALVIIYYQFHFSRTIDFISYWSLCYTYMNLQCMVLRMGAEWTLIDLAFLCIILYCLVWVVLWWCYQYQNYIALNGGTNSVVFERKGSWPNWCTIQAFSWTDWEKWRNTAVRINWCPGWNFSPAPLIYSITAKPTCSFCGLWS